MEIIIHTGSESLSGLNSDIQRECPREQTRTRCDLASTVSDQQEYEKYSSNDLVVRTNPVERCASTDEGSDILPVRRNSSMDAAFSYASVEGNTSIDQVISAMPFISFTVFPTCMSGILTMRRNLLNHSCFVFFVSYAP